MHRLSQNRIAEKPAWQQQTSDPALAIIREQVLRLNPDDVGRL